MNARFADHFSAVAANYANARPRLGWIGTPMIDNAPPRAALPASDA